MELRRPWALLFLLLRLVGAYHVTRDYFGTDQRKAIQLSLPGTLDASLPPTKLVVMLHGYMMNGTGIYNNFIFPENHAYLVCAPSRPTRPTACCAFLSFLLVSWTLIGHAERALIPCVQRRTHA